MLPIGKGRGQIWHGDKFLCDVDYDISPDLTFVSVAGTQRIQLEVHDYECKKLLNISGQTLILADGSHHRLPRPLNFDGGDGYFECFLNTNV